MEKFPLTADVPTAGSTATTGTRRRIKVKKRKRSAKKPDENGTNENEFREVSEEKDTEKARTLQKEPTENRSDFRGGVGMGRCQSFPLMNSPPLATLGVSNYEGELLTTTHSNKFSSVGKP